MTMTIMYNLIKVFHMDLKLSCLRLGLKVPFVGKN